MASDVRHDGVNTAVSIGGSTGIARNDATEDGQDHRDAQKGAMEGLPSQGTPSIARRLLHFNRLLSLSLSASQPTGAEQACDPTRRYFFFLAAVFLVVFFAAVFFFATFFLATFFFATAFLATFFLATFFFVTVFLALLFSFKLTSD